MLTMDHASMSTIGRELGGRFDIVLKSIASTSPARLAEPIWRWDYWFAPNARMSVGESIYDACNGWLRRRVGAVGD